MERGDGRWEFALLEYQTMPWMQEWKRRTTQIASTAQTPTASKDCESRVGGSVIYSFGSDLMKIIIRYFT